MSNRGYRSGDFKRVCDVCGFDHYASDTLHRWDGLIVCRADWEPRHPQDFVRGTKDRIRVPDPRPVPPYVFHDGAPPNIDGNVWDAAEWDVDYWAD